jgi:Flp pilus assembly pilin Flp
MIIVVAFQTMMIMFRRILSDQSGATAIEYALIAVSMSIVAIAAYALVVNSVENNYYSLIATIPR